MMTNINVTKSQNSAQTEKVVVFIFVVFCLLITRTASAESLPATVTVGSIPYGVAYDSEKGQIFVTMHNSNTVSVISYSSPSSVPEFGPLTGFIVAISLTSIIIIPKFRLTQKI